ncbi:unnamed protein product [Meloidogyne enterolobii]|uniref:Uncharacterized protein n=1 Tax=Meloidogyne enterolobii TaxID=390850 RepID=A0ACB0XS38_MELEN
MERIVVRYRDREMKYRGRGYNPATPSRIVEYSLNEFQPEESFDFIYLLRDCNDPNIIGIDQTDNALIKESVRFPLNFRSRVINKCKIRSRVIKSKEIKEKISYLGEKAENERKKENIECTTKNETKDKTIEFCEFWSKLEQSPELYKDLETKTDENKQIEIGRDNKLPIKEENLKDLVKNDKTIEFLPNSELTQEFQKDPGLNGETFKENKQVLFIENESLPINEKFPIDTQKNRIRQKE